MSYVEKEVISMANQSGGLPIANVKPGGEHLGLTYAAFLYFCYNEMVECDDGFGRVIFCRPGCNCNLRWDAASAAACRDLYRLG